MMMNQRRQQIGSITSHVVPVMYPSYGGPPSGPLCTSCAVIFGGPCGGGGLIQELGSSPSLVLVYSYSKLQWQSFGFPYHH